VSYQVTQYFANYDFNAMTSSWANTKNGGAVYVYNGNTLLWTEHPNTNLGGMRDQYICHQQIAFAKRTSNLDEWRPDVSYSATVRARCNPGGGPD
jgi:hypothetical protein